MGYDFRPLYLTAFLRIYCRFGLQNLSRSLLHATVGINSFGLMSLIFMVILAWQMFQSRLVAMIAAVLGVFLSHRLLLSVAPMSEILFNFFVLAGCTALVLYGKSGSARAFILAALMFMLSGTVRFEGWFLCAAFVLTAGVFQLWSRPTH